MTDLIIYKWFANPIWETQLDLDNNELINYAYSLKSEKESANRSNRGGWQCAEIENPPPAYSNLLREINNTFVKVHEIMGLKSEYQSYVTEHWININFPGSYNLRHLHPRSLFSGVYYAKVPNGDCGDVVFFRDNVMLSYLPNYIVKEWNDMTSGTATYTIRQGMLLIFPSWFEHSVTTNLSKEDRISISFNTNYF